MAVIVVVVVVIVACSLRRNVIEVDVAIAITKEGIRINSMDCIH